MTRWKYTASEEIPEILGSGSTFNRMVTTYDEGKAFELLEDGRNRLERSGKVNGKFVEQIFENGQWI